MGVVRPNLLDALDLVQRSRLGNMLWWIGTPFTMAVADSKLEPLSAERDPSLHTGAGRSCCQRNYLDTKWAALLWAPGVLPDYYFMLVYLVVWITPYQLLINTIQYQKSYLVLS